MALNIISNFAANVAQRNLVISDREATASLSKISAGKRVISAKDDAASLAIGSRLRAEIEAMKQANNNAGQAGSMLQIADGALDTIAEILIRMKTLAVQSSSGQFSTTERSVLDSEFQALSSEITRISNDTEFNGTQLIAGTSSNATTTTTVLANIGLSNVEFDTAIHPATGDVYAVTYTASTNLLTFVVGDTESTVTTGLGNATATLDASAVNALAGGEVLTVALSNGITVDVLDTFDTATDITLGAISDNLVAANADITAATVTFSAASGSSYSPSLVTDLLSISGAIDANSASYDSDTGVLRLAVIVGGTTANHLVVQGFGGASDIIALGGAAGASAGTITTTGTFAVTVGSITLGVVSISGVTASTTATEAGFIDLNIGQGVVTNTFTATGSDSVFTYKVGTGTQSYDDLSFTIAAASAAALGVLGTDQAGALEITTVDLANTASGLISLAIDTLNSQRAVIGAAQNRLTFAGNNLAIAIENAEAARSSLLDLDVASEMSVFTSKQILVQVGVSMLAQANQLPQNLLRLFQ
ncbi:MAG: flagellin [Alphaproteobacteria bacterium]|nr:flagellin [Alphaproteobacteria bacterium]